VTLWFMYKVRYGFTNWIWHWGAIVFEICVALVVAAVMLNARAPLARVLAFRPLVWIGRRAYGIYLIHTFVFTFLDQKTVDLGDWGSMVFQFALVFVVAALSFRSSSSPRSA